MTPPRYLTVRKASELLGVPERTITAWCAAGRLPGAWQPAGYSGRWLVPEATLMQPTQPADVADTAETTETMSSTLPLGD